MTHPLETVARIDPLDALSRIATAALACGISAYGVNSMDRPNPNPTPSARVEALANLVMSRYTGSPASDHALESKPRYGADVIIPLAGGKMAALYIQSSTGRPNGEPVAQSVNSIVVSINPDSGINSIRDPEVSITLTRIGDGIWQTVGQNYIGNNIVGLSSAANSFVSPDRANVIIQDATKIASVKPGQIQPLLESPPMPEPTPQPNHIMPPEMA